LALLGVAQWLLLWAIIASGWALTGAWLLGAAAMLAAAPLAPAQRYFGMSGVVIALCAAKWLLRDALAPRLDAAWDPDAARVLINTQVGAAMAIALLAAVYDHARSRAERTRVGESPGKRTSGDRAPSEATFDDGPLDEASPDDWWADRPQLVPVVRPRRTASLTEQTLASPLLGAVVLVLVALSFEVDRWFAQ